MGDPGSDAGRCDRSTRASQSRRLRAFDLDVVAFALGSRFCIRPSATDTPFHRNLQRLSRSARLDRAGGPVGTEQAPPRPIPFQCDRVGHGRIYKQLIAPKSGQHGVVDGAGHANQSKHSPQGANVGHGEERVVPLIQTPVHAMLVMAEPQLRDQAWEANGQHRVQHTLPTKDGMAPVTPDPSEPEADHEDRQRRRRRAIDDCLSVAFGRGAIGEPKAPSNMLGWLMDAALCQQSAGT